MRLIDADELQKTFTEECCGCCDCCSHSMTGYKCELIDNAPTVEERPTTCPNCDSGYAQGYSDGYLQGKEERPTGEWKCFIGSAHYGVDEDNEPIWRIRKIYHCPFCNRRTVIKENYCPNCGADMRGCKE